MYPPFTPRATGNKSLAVTDASASVALLSHDDGAQILVVNAGSNIAFVEFGGAAVVAAATGLPLLPGVSMLMTIGAGASYMAGISTTGLTTTLYACLVDGE